MFKYTANKPESALSVLAASFRLYFASFLYSITLSIVASMTFLATNYFAENHLDMTNIYNAAIPGSISSILGLIFFIPLIKRIYSVGAGLPITTAEAFSGFFIHFIRLTIFVFLIAFAGAIIPVLWKLSNIQTQSTLILIPFFLIAFVYIYIALKIYFTPIFIVLENKSVIESLKASLRIEHHHLWLTFCVLALYCFGYWAVVSSTSGLLVWQPLGIDFYTLLLSIITLPLFMSIQICQFFNLKRLAQ